jgi:hypothetical protein
MFVMWSLSVSAPGKLKSLLNRSGNRTNEQWFASPMELNLVPSISVTQLVEHWGSNQRLQVQFPRGQAHFEKFGVNTLRDMNIANTENYFPFQCDKHTRFFFIIMPVKNIKLFIFVFLLFWMG